ncbi:hypothetical protein HW532_10485 [Kaustia mangrovi]|uniref:Uncharacterized protein n=1 Tax=Kaustia mangrovi TaxID=2593653 RepID=A0A7S8HBV3_9HYPH|nr:hypothetical protein [Kaustia mangrovi]QPC43077.1 hypothetical protein HW532_10485 [Kaustia mangrovi]
MQTQSAALAADLPSPSASSRDGTAGPGLSTFALEARVSPGPDALLRVLNPLQKLAIAPLTVRAGRAWGGELMMVEVQFTATAVQARQFRTQVSSEISVESVELMRCTR